MAAECRLNSNKYQQTNHGSQGMHQPKIYNNFEPQKLKYMRFRIDIMIPMMHRIYCEYFSIVRY